MATWYVNVPEREAHLDFVSDQYPRHPSVGAALMAQLAEQKPLADRLVMLMVSDDGHSWGRAD